MVGISGGGGGGGGYAGEQWPRPRNGTLLSGDCPYDACVLRRHVSSSATSNPGGVPTFPYLLDVFSTGNKEHRGRPCDLPPESIDLVAAAMAIPISRCTPPLTTSDAERKAHLLMYSSMVAPWEPDGSTVEASEETCKKIKSPSITGSVLYMPIPTKLQLARGAQHYF